MNKRRIVLSVTALVLIAVFILPGLAYRISWEQTSKVYVAAVDLNRVAEFFAEEALPEVIGDYKKSGVTTAVITESRGQYPENLIALAKEAGLNIALTPDVTVAEDAQIERLVEQYDVKYIRLQKSKTKVKTEMLAKSEPVCRAIDEHDLTLVLTETIWQLKNEEPVHYEDYLEAANGNILRTFNTYKKTNVDNKDYNAVYYQMYNSAYERNARFITVLQLEDEGFTPEENAARTQESIRLFCDKMESHGFVNEGSVDYNTYTPNLTPIRAAAAAIGVLMAVLMVELLVKKGLPWLLPAGLALAAGAFGISFVLPQQLLQLYPTLFVFVAPSFCIAAAAVYVKKQKSEMGLVPLTLTATGLSLVLLVLSGSVVAAMLSGPEYFLNDLAFQGVKVSLVLPMVFVACLIFASVYRKRTIAEYKKMAADIWYQIRWYHVVLFAAVGVVAMVYVIRSGNVNEISFAEAYFRNLLTEVFTARPRTKEFLVGWPSLVLYIYYAKTGRSKLMQYIFAFGASILFASTVNTFCHVFTLAETFYLRVATGLMFGAVVAVVALGVNSFLLNLIVRYEAGRKNP